MLLGNGRLDVELQLSRPLTPGRLVCLNVIVTAARLAEAVERLLEPHGLSRPQYNVLRILRGAGESGLCCQQIAARTIERQPDLTRLLGRLEGRGLICRWRDPSDGRAVRSGATPAALALLASLDEPLAELESRCASVLGEAACRRLAADLEQVRGSVQPPQDP